MINDEAERRDRFAMAALTGLLANAKTGTLAATKPDGTAVIAYRIADQMMRIRTAKNL